MKRVVFLGAVLLLLACPTAFADNIHVGDIIKLEPSTGGGVHGGGPFDVYKKIGVSTFGFQFTTFCVEMTETFRYDTPYLVSSITTTTVATGHTLTNQAAWLYYMYRTSPGVFGGTIDLTALQVAIWHFMGWDSNISSTWKTANYDTYVSKANDAVNLGHWVNSNVRIMNLTSTDGKYNKQDQLMLAPATVPEPSVILLLGLGLVSVSLLSRRARARGR